MNTMKWLIKREFWEHRGGFFWAPLIAGSIAVLFSLVAAVAGTMLGRQNGMQVHGNDAEIAEAMGAVGDVALLSGICIALAILAFVVFFYCLGSLYDDRRDRSILFWKSLPATDTATVLSKLVTATLVAPFLAFVATIILHLGVLVVIGLYVGFHGVNPMPFLWQPGVIGQVWSQMLLMIPVHMLWAIPGIAWLLLASSWARRAPFVWALLIPVLCGMAYAMLETALRLKAPSIWFWEHVVARIFLSPGSMLLRPWQWRGNPDIENPFMGAVGWDRMQTILSSPETWIGLVVGAVLLGAAIWLRRYRDDS